MSINYKPNLLSALTKGLPVHKDNKRIWIASNKLNDTDLAKNCTYNYKIDAKNKRLIIVSNEDDNRKITRRKSSSLPIIDICNQDITSLFYGIDKVTIKIFKNSIIIEPLKESIEQLKAKKKLKSKKITFVDIFAGSGTLSESFKSAGMVPLGATELNERYLSNYEKNNPNTFTYSTDITQIDLELLPKEAVVVIGGVPCECFSSSGIVKQCSLGQKSKEAGHTGSLGYFFLQAIEKIRPAVVVIEEVIGFQKSVMMDIIRSVLVLRGYSISEKILKANEYGSMTKRKRFCMVATISHKPFLFSSQQSMNLRTVGEILEVPIENRIWLDKNNSKSIAYSLEKEQAHIEKKEGFRIARTSTTDTIAATITKGYYKNRLTDPILVHPDNNERFSWFTPRELARINGLPDSFILPDGKKDKTISGEIIGQGVAFEPFFQVAKDIISHIRRG